MLNGLIAWVLAAAIAVPVALVIRPLPRTLVALTVLAHAAFVVSVAIFPVPIDRDMTRLSRMTGWTGNAARFVALTPFETIGDSLRSGVGSNEFIQAVQNLLVLAPFAVYAPLLRPRLRSWAVFLPVALVVGCSIETAQLAVSLVLGFPYRSIDIDDAILNTAGIIGVFAAYRLALAVLASASGAGRTLTTPVSPD